MSEITKQIRARLEHEPAINLHASNVDITDEGVIRLAGAVPDIRAKRKAVRIAILMSEGKGVADDLQVAPEDRQGDDKLVDILDLSLRMDSVFREHRIIKGSESDQIPDGNGIRVTARDGILRLDGQVPSLSHRRLAEVMAWWVPGVVDVDNRLRLERPEEDNDGEISEAIRLVLEKDRTLQAHEINALVREGEVTLAGRVAAHAQAERAERDCWYIPGIHEVRNELKVVPSQ